jgi:hypothetical protein
MVHPCQMAPVLVRRRRLSGHLEITFQIGDSVVCVIGGIRTRQSWLTCYGRIPASKAHAKRPEPVMNGRYIPVPMRSSTVASTVARSSAPVLKLRMSSHGVPRTCKLSRSPIARAAASSIIAMPRLTLTQGSTAASPLFLSGPPASSPLYLANAAISCSSASSTCLSQLPLRSRAAGSRKHPERVPSLPPPREWAHRRRQSSATCPYAQRGQNGSAPWYRRLGWSQFYIELAAKFIERHGIQFGKIGFAH